jgi:hypothetical protein
VGGGPQVAEEPVASDQAAVLPAVQHVAQGGLADQALDPGGAGRQPAQEDTEDVGAGGVLLAEPAQGGDVAVGDAGVGVPARPPGRPTARPAAAGCPGAGTVDVGARPGAASPKEALLGHDGTSDGGWGGAGTLATPRLRDDSELRRPGARWAVLEQAQ